MIDFQETKTFLKLYTQFYSNITNCGLYHDGDNAPQYRWKNNEELGLCKLKKENIRLNNECNRFYLGLTLGVSMATCPLGILIKYNKVKTAFGIYTMLT